MTQDGISIDELMAVKDLSSLPVWDGINFLGTLINAADDERRADAATNAIALADGLRRYCLSRPVRAHIEYFVSNAYAVLHSIEAAGGRNWEWTSPALAQQIFHLRLALREFGKQPRHLHHQIWTNLGNALSHVGRVVEAIECWDRVIEEDPAFGMAVGNRGIGLESYAASLADPGHEHTLLAFAHKDLVAAAELPTEGNAGLAFAAARQRIESETDEKHRLAHLSLREYPLGHDPTEIAYRGWCLKERLFVNPLNDLGPHSVAARDALVPPPIVAVGEKPPHYLLAFNAFKQEFTAARFFLFDAIHGAEEEHFADRGVVLVDTGRDTLWSWRIERLRAAYRAFYSMFDKIGFFLNSYMKVGIQEWQVNFRTMWYVDRDPRKGLRPEFAGRKNWALRGLFWLSKDLHDRNPKFREVLQPDARDVADVRNALEHKDLQVHPNDWEGDRGRDTEGVFHVRYDDLVEKTLRIGKLARAALIYLALILRSEEIKKPGATRPLPVRKLGSVRE